MLDYFQEKSKAPVLGDLLTGCLIAAILVGIVLLAYGLGYASLVN
jgi:hypothetical protein